MNLFNIPPTAKVIWGLDHALKSHPTDWRSWDRTWDLWVQGKWLIHDTMAASSYMFVYGMLLEDYVINQS